MKVQFKTDPEQSFFHAMCVVALDQRAVDMRLETVLQPIARVLNERLELAEISVPKFWESLECVAAESEGARVEQALIHAGCAELGVDMIAPAILGRLADARLGFREAFPKLAEQLPLRARPLRDLWDTVGPGLLREIGRRTVEKIIPQKSLVHLVQPARGGDGGVFGLGDGVWIEAMLTHPDPRIPETLRMAWLIARMGVQRLPSIRFVDADRLPRLASLALLPIVIGAGSELELCPSGDATIRSAAELWHVDWDVDVLSRWWEEMEQNQLPLPVALKALDKMLQDS